MGKIKKAKNEIKENKDRYVRAKESRKERNRAESRGRKKPAVRLWGPLGVWGAQLFCCGLLLKAAFSPELSPRSNHNPNLVNVCHSHPGLNHLPIDTHTHTCEDTHTPAYAVNLLCVLSMSTHNILRLRSN